MFALQVAETLDSTILAKMHAPDKPEVPVISAKQLTEADGLVFGVLAPK
jgi:NAD(P)H dehydrogenase (quinone)